MVSKACRKRRIAASPRVRLSSSASAGSPLLSKPAPTVAAPAAAVPFFRNERRLVLLEKRLKFLSIVDLLSRLDFVFNGVARQIRLVGLDGVLVSRKNHEKDKLFSTSRALLAKDLGDEIKAVGEGRWTVCGLRTVTAVIVIIKDP